MKALKKKCAKPEKRYAKNWKNIRKTTRQQSLKKLKNYEALRNLPLTDYKTYTESFRKTLASKTNPFNGEKIHFWATSTGSSGIPKTFPISPAVDKATATFAPYRVAMLVNEFNLYKIEPELIFVMPGEKEAYAPKLPIGQIGYYYYRQNMPDWLEDKFIFSKALYKDKALFNEWHVILSLFADCSGMTTSIPARLFHYFNQINANREEIRERLMNEEWPVDLSHFKDQKRIDFVIKALEEPLRNVKKLWPTLQFVCLWMAGESCQRQLKELTRHYDFTGIRFIDQVYNASEAVFNIPLLDEVGGPTNIFNGILEFYHAKTDRFYWPWELTENELYEPIITNEMGLTRYRMYDNVICTGYYEKTAKIAFHSRAFPEISLGWGVVTETELKKALEMSGIDEFSSFYFTLNSSGNGLSLVTAKAEFENQIPQLEKNLIQLNPNYGEQLLKGNFSALTFQFVSPQKYADVMLQNGNHKRLLI